MASTSRPRSAQPQVITHAAQGRSVDRRRREVRYLAAMGVRVVCFVGAFFAPGWWKLALIAVAVIVPSIAVMVANVRDERRGVVEEDHVATPENALESGRTILLDDDACADSEPATEIRGELGEGRAA